MTGPKDIVIAALVVLLIASGTTIGCQSLKNGKLKSDIVAVEAKLELSNSRILEANEQVVQCREEINLQNESIKVAEEMGEKAKEAQRKIDEYALRLTYATERLNQLTEEQMQFERMTSELDVCETYELALRSISGEAL